MAAKYNKSSIIWLYLHGYRQKLIQLILGYPQPTVSKAIANKDKIMADFDLDETQLMRKYVIDRFLELRPIPCGGYSDNDKCYIKWLDYLLVDHEKIKKLYYNISQYRVNNALRTDKVDMLDFMPQLIGLEDAEYNVLADYIRNLRSN